MAQKTGLKLLNMYPIDKESNAEKDGLIILILI